VKVRRCGNQVCARGVLPADVPPFTFTFTLSFMKVSAALEKYYVLPCCLLLLNLANEIIAYKARLIEDGLLRTLFIMGMVLFGASLVAFAIAPAIIWCVQSLRRTSRSAGGGAGELLFLVVLGGLIFWLYYRNYLIGTEAIVPAAWHNPGR
jgi:hypothetical protein